VRFAAALLAGLLVASCGDAAPPKPRAAATPTATRTLRPTPTPPPPPVRKLPAPPCRPDIPRCASASGTIVYVERVDPDGDGDLHVVVTDRHAVTLAGLTSIDVSKDLRPRRDPRIGERAAGMGPVQRGSYGQDQIHALVFRTRR
jgi:hypothetical protein